MTTIRELLTPYYATGEWANPEAKRKFELQFGLGDKLARDLESLGADPGGAYFNYCWRKHLGRHPFDKTAVHPDDVVGACAYLGFTDIEPLVDWAKKISPAMVGGMAERLALVDVLELTLPSYTTARTISFMELIEQFRANGANIASGAILHAKDNGYKLLNRADVQTVAMQFATRARPYVPESHDCDEFAGELVSLFDAAGFGDSAICYEEMTLMLPDGTLTGAHACCAAAFDDGTAALIEPQTGALYPMNAVWLGGGVNGMPDRNEIYWLEV